MKLIPIFSLLALNCFFSLFFLGCASTGGSETSSNGEASVEETSVEQTSGSTGAKTAYEGTTGSGLLMERYKAGQIEGYRE